jgi:hypothetical protein
VNNEIEKLNKDIKTLLEKIRVDWLDHSNSCPFCVGTPGQICPDSAEQANAARVVGLDRHLRSPRPTWRPTRQSSGKTTTKGRGSVCAYTTCGRLGQIGSERSCG